MLAVTLASGWFLATAAAVAQAPAREHNASAHKSATGGAGEHNTGGRWPSRSPSGPSDTRQAQDWAKTRLSPGSSYRGLYRGHTAAHWAAWYRHRTRQLQNTRRVLFARPSVVEALNLACVVYGNCSALWRKAQCESRFNPGADNGEARGLLQFLDSTWASTPFGRFSVYSPYANALAAGWMHAQGRGSEWACR